MYNIGISCVGGGVGQSVINSCRLSRLPIRTIGLDTNPFAYGAYDCDVFDSTLSVQKENYICDLIEKCKEHDIDLVIPGLDDEILMYAQHIELFEQAGIETIVSGEDLIKLCRDKEQMSLQLNPVADVFVTSYDKDTLAEEISRQEVSFPLIAKPRGGSASKGIAIIQDERDLDKIRDNHIVQELAIPAKDDPNHQYYLKQIGQNKNPQVSEISIQIVTDKNGNLLGRMASCNKLKDGIPVEIVPIEDNRIWSVVDELMPHFTKLGLRGPLNIQGRLTENGLKIFEMNPRFTGITGLRALMGFNEVESCIASWLDIEREDNFLALNRNRFGVRQTADKAVPIQRNRQVNELSVKRNAIPNQAQKTLLVTGAGSHLGQRFIQSILNNKDYRLWAYGCDGQRLASLFPQKEVHLFDKDDYTSGRLALGNVDILLHLHFADTSQDEQEIADRLAFTHDLFTSAAMHQVPALIHVSSYHVYGSDPHTLGDELTPVAPYTSFAQAVYAAELMLRSMNRMNKQVRFTSLRMATLTGGDQEDLSPVDPVARFIQNILNSDEPDNTKHTRTLEWLDIRDAVHAVRSVLATPEEQWKPVYNVGSGVAYSTTEITRMVLERIGQLNNGDKTETVIDTKDMDVKLGMDSSLFRKDTGWEPSYNLDDTIDHLCQHLQAAKKHAVNVLPDSKGS